MYQQAFQAVSVLPFLFAWFCCCFCEDLCAKDESLVDSFSFHCSAARNHMFHFTFRSQGVYSNGIYMRYE